MTGMSVRAGVAALAAATIVTVAAGHGGGCDLTCDKGGLLEDEPCGDDSNGGCNSPEVVFGVAGCDTTVCGSAWAAGGTRDTDWFTFSLDTDAEITIQLVSEFAGMAFIVEDVEGCAVIFGDVATSDGCQAGPSASAGLGPGLHAVFVAVDGFDGVPCGSANDYLLSITCTPDCPADTNDDGLVNVDDLVNVILEFGSLVFPFYVDINGDGVVDVEDVIAVVLAWGPC